MSKLNINDVEVVRDSKTMEFLAGDINDSSSIGKCLLDFCNSTDNNLKGEVWDKFRNKYAEYNSILIEQSSIASELSTAISDVIKEIQDNMNGYSNLDLSKIDEVRQQKLDCLQLIADIQTKMSKKIWVYVGPFPWNYVEQPAYDNAALARDLVKYKEDLTAIDDMLQTMEKLKEICDKAEQKLSDILSKMGVVNDRVNSIIPSEIVVFSPLISL